MVHVLLVSDSKWVIADPLPPFLAMPERTRWQRARKARARITWVMNNPDLLMYQMTSILDRVEARELGGPPRWAEMRHVEG